MTSIAIMQPTYMPWIGYLAMMDAVDIFVYLDSVQFDRRSWQQRNRIKSASGELMLTVPVLKKGRREQKILEVEINHDNDPLETHARSIALSYAHAPFAASCGDELLHILRRRSISLVELNFAVLDWMREILGIATPTARSSALAAVGQRADLLAAICAELGADRYVAPPGSRDYLSNSTAMRDRGIEVVYFDYACRPYHQQHGDFMPYLSAVDLVLNCGAAGSQVMRAGVRDVQQAEGS